MRIAKKIIITILIVLILAFLTISGFYIYDNKENIKNWINNKTVSSHENVDMLEILSQKTFNEFTWDEFAYASEHGIAPQVLNIGDEKTFNLKSGEEVTIQILGFEHDPLSDGSGYAGVTVGLKNCLATPYVMNNEDTNVGGYTSSLMRTVTLVDIYNLLPDEFQSIIKVVKKKTSEGNKSSTIVETDDKLFLFSHEEIYGISSSSDTTPESFKGEGTQYEYFKSAPIPSPNEGTGAFTALSGDSGTFYTSDISVASGFKSLLGGDLSTTQNVYYNYFAGKVASNEGRYCEYWLRSPTKVFTNSFCTVNGTLCGNTNFASTTFCYVSFGCCV